MENMFFDAASFKQEICGSHWAHSKASKKNMFGGVSSGSISRTACITTPTAFSSQAELRDAVDTCLKLSPEGDCKKGPHGPIAIWDVSSVTDMTRLFARRSNSFNGDISKWDVSKVTSMHGMFFKAALFNVDISEWDVSSVTDMTSMFLHASSFNRDISKWDVSSVVSMASMFRLATAFNHDISKWDVSRVTSMDFMFFDATSFDQEFCGSHWIESRASQKNMFGVSPGSISRPMCTTTTAATTTTTTTTATSYAAF